MKLAAHHSFKAQLAWSEAQSDEPFWDAVYRKAFPNLVSHVTGPGDYDSQRQGVDRVLVLSNNRLLRIDEKKRSANYPDILLEYVSVDVTGALGWIEKDLSIDYLAYAFMPALKVYLLPWILLRKAWKENREAWMSKAEERREGFRVVQAQNFGYSTWSLAVPIPNLYSAINRASIIEVDLQEDDPFSE
jgi:hypothetical protein